MKYSTIRPLDVANGPGIRVTIFVSGCTHNCKGCFNEELQDFNHGSKWTKEDEDRFIEMAKKDQITGISILGGEPLEQIMDDDLYNLISRIKNQLPQKKIWLWTGDIYEEALKNEKKERIIKLIDVLVDGPFVLEKRNMKLKYRGSENQRVIDIPASQKMGEVVLIEGV